MTRTELLRKNFQRVCGLPWDRNVAGAQRVWVAVYDKEDERKLRLRLGLFEEAAQQTGHPWHALDLTDAFADWMTDPANAAYAASYFESPDLLDDAVLADFKRWVTHELLPEVRRTGSYAVPQSREQRLALAVIDAQAMLTEKDERIAVLEPSAHAWDALADSVGDYSLRDAAQILSQDPSIEIGQNRLAKFLHECAWIDPRGVPYQRHVDVGRIQSKPQTRLSHRTGERIVCDPQVRVTVKGLGALHTLLGGTGPVATTITDVAA